MKKNSHKIIQLSDIHLLSTHTALLHNINTYQNLKILIDYINTRPCDLLLITGDISQDGTIESYQLFKQEMLRCHHEICIIPGNHDNPHHMTATLSNIEHVSFPKKYAFLNWEIHFINSNLSGKTHGYIDLEETEKILQTLNFSCNKHLCIVMHHHPLSVGTPLVDKYRIKNGKMFVDKIKQHQQIKLIIFGHVHNNYSFHHEHIRFESSPAACFQITKGATIHSIENKIGLKEYHFTRDNVTVNCLWRNHYVAKKFIYSQQSDTKKNKPAIALRSNKT